MDTRELERASSAVTLSDMEVFIFPELMYSLVLANLMSPRIWTWRADPWFADIDTLKPYKRMQRVRQYIMDNYAFNLDLDTWGLTTKERELERFRSVISADDLARSNALFGYEGDSYYFSIDIRTHFGLDKYTTDVIPYWKTETIEAMDAFRHREGYTTGAGECVSLAALYATALYALGGFALDDIYMLATPLHSQNFVDVNGGVLTNNRRLVTKSMWFNGTAISGQARRALENERISIVAHPSGWIHTFYPRATIDPAVYAGLTRKLQTFLHTDLTPEALGSFLRQSPDSRSCFMVRHVFNGTPHYLPLDEAFRYEQECECKITDASRPKLLELVPHEAFALSVPRGKLLLDDVEAFIASHRIDLDRPEDVAALKAACGCTCLNVANMVESLARFCHTEPQLPNPGHATFDRSEPKIDLPAGLEPEEIRRRLEGLRTANPTVDLAFHALRDLDAVPAEPFLYAALTRNPVCVEGAKALDDAALIARVAAWTDESIYDGVSRFAQPDEVWNCRRGDGLERLLLVATVLAARGRTGLAIRRDGDRAELLEKGALLAALPTRKRFRGETWPLN